MVFTVKAPVKVLDIEDIDLVWKHFIDFNHWHEWNSFVQGIDIHGPVEEGTPFVMKVNMFNRIIKTNEIFVSIDHEQHNIQWRYNQSKYLGISAHRTTEFKRDPATNKILYYSQEVFSGYLSWLLEYLMYDELLKQFTVMTEDFNNYLNTIANK